MELVEGRGINCENEVYFDYVDGEIVMTMYRDMAGVRMDRRDPNVIKSFSIDQWEEINGYLREVLDDAEGVCDDGDEGDVIKIDSEGKVHPPKAAKILSEMHQLRKEGMEKEEAEGLRKLEEMEVDKAFAPKVRDLPDAADTSNVELPKVNSIPSMTGDGKGNG